MKTKQQKAHDVYVIIAYTHDTFKAYAKKEAVSFILICIIMSVCV